MQCGDAGWGPGPEWRRFGHEESGGRIGGLKAHEHREENRKEKQDDAEKKGEITQRGWLP